MLAIATAALLVFSATVEAATSKYDYGGREKYKHEYHGSYKPFYKHGAYESEHMRGDGGYEDYSYEPSYASPYADREYREPRDESHDEDHYDRDVYFEEPSYAYDYESSPAKRYTRSVKDQMGVREDQVLIPFGGKIGKKLGKILHDPVLKKVSKKFKRSVREGLQTEFGGCCREIQVRSAKSGMKGVKSVYPERFQLYRWTPSAVEGKDQWWSNDQKFAIWSNAGKWIIGPIGRRGSGGEPEDEIDWGVIRTDEDEACPEDVGFKWQYWGNNELNSAERGLRVICELE